jgi:hypothetical protein
VNSAATSVNTTAIITQIVQSGKIPCNSVLTLSGQTAKPVVYSCQAMTSQNLVNKIQHLKMN